MSTLPETQNEGFVGKILTKSESCIVNNTVSQKIKLPKQLSKIGYPQTLYSIFVGTRGFGEKIGSPQSVQLNK